MINEYVVIHSPLRLSNVYSELDAVKKNFVRIKFLFCGICGSDKALYYGRDNVKYPRTIGHEFAAEIIELGDNVFNFAIGDIVTSDLNYRCQKCQYCTSNRSHLCEKNAIGLFTNRGFAKYADFHKTYLQRANSVFPLYRVTLIEPLACVLNAISKNPPEKEEKIFINGVGSIGTLLVFALITMYPNSSIHINDNNQEKIASLLDIFPNNVFKANAAQYIKNTFSLVFDVTADPYGLRVACTSLDKGGKLCIISHYDRYNIDFLNHYLARKDATVTFPYLTGGSSNMIKAEKMIKKYWTDEMDSSFLGFYSLFEIESALKNELNTVSNKPIIKIS